MEDKVTPEVVEVKTDPTPPVETEAKPTEVAPPVVKEEVKKEETIGEVLKAEADDSVPLATFLETKKNNKVMAKQIKDLEAKVADGATKKEVASSIKAIANKHGVDEALLEDIADVVRAQTKSETEEVLRPLKEKEMATKINKAFETQYNKVLESMPEYNGVVNKAVIKTLSLDKANANKTFTQLIEESYGHLITGKKSLDSASTRTNKNDNMEVDIKKASTDSEYFKQVMADPVLKKKYNDTLIARNSSQL